MKKIGFLSFGHWQDSPESAVRTPRQSLHQAIDLAVAAEEIGADGAFFRVHHFAQRLSSPFPLLAAISARTSRIEIGTGVIDMRYENPAYMAETAAAADLISDGRLHLGLSRGSPEQAIESWRHFGSQPRVGESGDDLGRRQTERLLQILRGDRFAEPNPSAMFPNPPGLLRLEPFAQGLSERIYWGSASDATARWAAEQGLNFQGGPLKIDESAEPFHVQQRRSIEAFREAWKASGHGRVPRVAVARTIYPLTSDRSRSSFAGQARPDQRVNLGPTKRGIIGRIYAAEPDALVHELRDDEAVASADTILLTIPSQLGVDCNLGLLAAVVDDLGPALGWRSSEFAHSAAAAPGYRLLQPA